MYVIHAAGILPHSLMEAVMFFFVFFNGLLKVKLKGNEHNGQHENLKWTWTLPCN